MENNGLLHNRHLRARVSAKDSDVVCRQLDDRGDSKMDLADDPNSLKQELPPGVNSLVKRTIRSSNTSGPLLNRIFAASLRLY